MQNLGNAKVLTRLTLAAMAAVIWLGLSATGYAQSDFKIRLDQIPAPVCSPPAPPCSSPWIIQDNGPDDMDPDPGSILVFGRPWGKLLIGHIVAISEPKYTIATSPDDPVPPPDLLYNVDLMNTTTLPVTVMVTVADKSYPVPVGPSLIFNAAVGGVALPAGAAAMLSFNSWVNPLNASPLDPGGVTPPPGSIAASLGSFASWSRSLSATLNSLLRPGSLTGPYSIFHRAVLAIPAKGHAGFSHVAGVQPPLPPS